jgi:CRISPR/Cas system CMR-associated protein Cmr5 small subunit
MNLDARIATKARVLVEARKQPADDKEHKEETSYRAWCEGFPVFLRTCGLLNTLAFFAQKDDERKLLCGNVQEQLRELGYNARIEALGLADYMLYSRVAMRIAIWHKRLAQALLRKVEKP